MENNLIKSEMPTTKSGISEMSKKLIDTILDGSIDVIKTEIQLKALEELISIIRKNKDVKQLLLSEVEKYSKDEKIYNTSFEVATRGVKYDYTNCNCEEYNSICRVIDKFNDKRKEVEKTLKALPLDGLVDPATGEVMYPPSKSGSTTVVTKLSKE